jgi:hypothetical protein
VQQPPRRQPCQKPGRVILANAVVIHTPWYENRIRDAQATRSESEMERRKGAEQRERARRREANTRRQTAFHTLRIISPTTSAKNGRLAMHATGTVTRGESHGVPP